MFEQHARGQPATTPDWPSEESILDWIDAWQPVREDVLKLMHTYAAADTGHDIHSFTPLIEQLDSAMRLLHHRVDWLRGYLGRTTSPTRNLD